MLSRLFSFSSTRASRLVKPAHVTRTLKSQPARSLSSGFQVPSTKYRRIAPDNKIVLLGFGSIGQGSLPLILRHLDVSPSQIVVITKDTTEAGVKEAKQYGIDIRYQTITPDNFEKIMGDTLQPGDFLLNVSVDVSSCDLIKLCKRRRALYLDTCIEPWMGDYSNPSKGAADRSNYALRETALVLKEKDAPTAVITHGANPGMVSHLVKEALLNVARDTDFSVRRVPTTKQEWAELAQALGIKVIHIAERDTQISPIPKRPGEFVNTWSIDGFVSEGFDQPSELGWGTHEKKFPTDGHAHVSGGKSAIWLNRPGAAQQVYTWTPAAGPILGYLVTHSESISISDYFTVKRGSDVVYRPTVHYAYHPCDAAVLSLHEAEGLNFQHPKSKRLMTDEITDGMDELGVLLMGHKKGAYWYGSQLDIHQARALVPFNNATSLQVTSSILAGMIYAMENPNLGVVEPDEIPFQRVMEIMRPYLGTVKGEYSDWTPLQGRRDTFPELVDRSCPWQFANFRVA